MRSPARLGAFQARAESLMTLTLVAYSPSLVADGAGIKVPGFTSEGSTFGKVQAPSATAGDTATRTVVVGGTHRPVLEGGLHIPISAYVADGVLAVKPGDQGIGWEFEVTSVGPLDDAGLTGRRFLVVGVPAKSYATARRLDVTEVTR